MADQKKPGSSGTGVARWKSENASATKGGSKAPSGGVQAARKRLAAESRRQMAALVVALVIVVASVVALFPLSSTFGWSLDFGGGTAYVYVASDADAAEEAAEVLQERLESVGVDGVRVSASDGEVTVQVPADQDAEEMVELCSGVGHLEFVNLNEMWDPEAIVKIEAGTIGFEVDSDYYVAMFDGSSVTSVSVGLYDYEYDEETYTITYTYGISVDLDDEAAEVFAEVTEQLAPVYGQIVVLFDGVVMASPSVSEAITSGSVTFSGDFSLQEALAIQAAIESGELPCTLTYSSTATIDSSLGLGSVALTVLAALGALALAAVALWLWARRSGLLVVPALAAAELVEVGGFALLSRLGVLEPTVGGLVAGLLAPVATLVVSVVTVVTLRRKVAEGSTPRDAALTLLGEQAKLVGIVALALVVVGAVWAVVAPDLATRGVGLAAVVAAPAMVVAWALVLVPLVKLAAAGSMRENPSGWGLAAPAKKASD